MGIMRSDKHIGKLYPFGYTIEEGAVYFCAAESCEALSLLLYKGGKRISEIAFPKEERIGDVWRLCVEGLELDGSLSYTYRADEKEFSDPYGRSFCGRERYKDRKNLKTVPRTIICTEAEAASEKTEAGTLAKTAPKVGAGTLQADLKAETGPSPCYKDGSCFIPYEDSIIYRLHVRGFTKDKSSGVEAGRAGTFYGIIDKLGYLKDLGVTSLELMPAYEYNETEHAFGREGYKTNYWGFTEDALRFAPKRSFGGAKGFRELIEALHREGMELILGMYFSGNEPEDYVLSVLRFWRMHYGLDGVHIIGYAPMRLLLCDPYLKGMKLWADRIGEQDLKRDKREFLMPVRKKEQAVRFAAVYDDSFQNDLRRFIKGDEDMVGRMMELIRSNPSHAARINYAANVSGFSLNDVFAYDRKHNEPNGENNTDGTDLNYSWNCGEEGPSRKKRINELRRQLYKNALVLTMLSAGTPLINAGDEMAHTKKGNNNSWCMDDRTEWICWDDLKKHEDIYQLTKALIRIRREHPVFRQSTELRGADYRYIGLPDISFHGKSAWKVDMENYRRQLAVCLNGAYSKRPDGTADDCFYIAMNMHWEAHKFYLPKLPEGKSWRLLLDTSEEISEDFLGGAEAGQELKFPDSIRIAARSVVILIGK